MDKERNTGAWYATASHAASGGGVGVAGVYVLDVAESKVATVHQAAETRGYPLRAGVEQE